MKRAAALTFLMILLITFTAPLATAGEVDILIKKLVERGILTQSDAEELKKEIRKEPAKEKAEREHATKELAAETAKEVSTKEAKASISKLPKWVQNTKVKGDLRLRYQNENRDGDSNPRRERGRFRLRVGIETEVNEQWAVGFGISSGGDDPRSTNQTLEDTFSSPDLRIDYAYARYSPFEWVDLLGGKFKNPIWKPKDLLWDSDIRPEGLAAPLEFDIHPDVELFLTPAFFILEEFKEKKGDPWMFAFQSGIKWKITDSVNFKLAGAYYVFHDVAGNSFDFSETTNSPAGSKTIANDPDAIAAGAELGFKFDGPIPYFGLFGELVKALGVDEDKSEDNKEDDLGYLVGFKFGHKEVEKFGQWQAKYNYRRLERDAWPDFLPDSDFYGGETNAKGHEAEFVFGLAKNVTIGADYYKAENIRGDEQEEDVLQIDLILKF